jgi:alpha-ketoglutarate-dependent taurine dioxygenase
LHIRTIGDLPEPDSLSLMAELIEHAVQPAHIYQHKWSVGDVVMWDNTSIMHRRTPFPSHERRHLKRTGFYLPNDLATPI